MCWNTGLFLAYAEVGGSVIFNPYKVDEGRSSEATSEEDISVCKKGPGGQRYSLLDGHIDRQTDRYTRCPRCPRTPRIIVFCYIITETIECAYTDRFGKAPPHKATLLDWEKRAFASGSVKDRPHSGRKKRREETCTAVAQSSGLQWHPFAKEQLNFKYHGQQCMTT
jgi:hypothetical protein